jgi:hypothetical protein
MIIVNSVQKPEIQILNQYVLVQLNIMKMLIIFVSLVISNVQNAKNKLITVLFVLVTEHLYLSVTVHHKLFKIQQKKHVHLVMNIVLLVLEPQIIVYNVLKPDITHQHVHLFHNPPNLLKFLISQ